MTTNYDIIDEEKVLAQIENDKQAELDGLDKTYADMGSKADQFYQDQITASKNWADTQTKLQNQQTDQTIKEINQQKDQAKKDYTKEQSGAYVDWQKQSNQYGVNAEKAAAQGMTGTGYSESSQVAMYNAYQNRIATAREMFNQATLNYNNAITNARLQNSSVLAEIAYNAYKEQAELGLKAAMYKDELLREKTSKELEIKKMYHNQWVDVLDLINKENTLKYQQDRDKVEDEQEAARLAQQKEIADAQLAEDIRQFNILHPANSGGGSGTISGGGSKIESPMDKHEKWKTTEASLEKDNGNKSKNPPVDMQSVLDLGYGPISYERAWELVKEGLAETYVKNGKTYFRKSSKYFKQVQLAKNRSGGGVSF